MTPVTSPVDGSIAHADSGVQGGMGGLGPFATSPHRPALDGLRALAVGGVVTYHLGATWLPGGFLGVDMFFVLSGFLITGIILRELSRTGRVDFGNFFARRARRLLPALYVLLIAVCAWALFVVTPNAIGDLRGAALAALCYVANWFFILTGQSYFGMTLGPSPLEHTWSLAIEEQYYLIWPLLLLLLVRKARGYVLTAVTVAVIVGSVMFMALTFDQGDPSVAYFGTFTRIHELLIGSLLAIVVHRGMSMPPRWRWTAWPAVALIAVAMATVSDMGAFYYRGGSLLFCVVVAWLVLALGTGTRGGSANAAFSWRPIAWIGLVSYGIYLWHWPLILWLTPVTTGLSGPALTGLRLGATLVIATASFYLIETPIRRGSLAGVALTPRRLAVVVPVAMAVLATVIVGSTARAATPDPQIDQTVAPSGLLGADLASAPTLAIAGDSVPKEAMPALAAEAKERGWNVVPLAYGGCSITTDYQVDAQGQPFNWSRRCSADLAAIQSQAIARYRPSIVLWWSNRERFPVEIGGQILQPDTQRHRANLDSALDAAYQRFTALGARVVIALPVTWSPAVLGACAVPGTKDPDCVTDSAYYASFDEITQAYERLAAQHPANVTLVRIDDVLCPGNRDCPLLEQGGEVVRPDGIHFSDVGAKWFAPLLFDRAGILALPAQEHVP